MKHLLTILIALLTCATSFAQSVIVKGTDAGNIRGTGAGSVRGVAVIPAQTDFYVSLNGSHTSPYDTWVKAATNIQDAVDVASASDTVIVSNGTYLLSAEIAVTSAITIKSKDNDSATVIVDGQSTVRCFNMSSTNAWLKGITVTHGHRAFGQGNGGGMLSGSALNCIFILNSAVAEGLGGGVDGSVLYYCNVISNSAGQAGGGARDSTLYNCILSGNASDDAASEAMGCTLYNCTVKDGSVWVCTLWNCILWDVGTAEVDNNVYYSCANIITPIGAGSITNNPVFVGGGDYRLQSNSPCIDTGTNQAWMTGAKDLDGNQRIWNTTVDMGAYEYGSEP